MADRRRSRPILAASATAGWVRGLLVALVLLYALPIGARTAEYGDEVWDAAGVEIVVFTYRPASCATHDILFVFHGLNRKASGVRDRAAQVARRQCLAVFAPLFDKDRFPNWRYHRAGVVRDGRVQPRARWTEPVFRALLNRARTEIGRADARLYLFGHSAGGQFLSRISAYSSPFAADRIVVANPSLHVAPSLEEAVPNGFGGLFEGDEALDRLRHYLGLPISIYLGEEDTRSKHLVTTEAANRQGANRLLRGRNIYRWAQRVAAERDWPFNWRLVEAAGVGHSSRGMLQAPEMVRALGVDDGEAPPD